MSGRRCHQRFITAPAATGALRVLRDVLVERATVDEFVVVGRYAGIVGEQLLMEVAEAPKAALPVRVTDSRPVVAEGAVRHQLTLKLPEARELLASNDLPEWMAAMSVSPALAVLIKEVPVRMLNCSASGCLLECSGRVEIGTAGSLRLLAGNEELVDDIQIVRCLAIAGGSTYRVGATFLWMAAPTGRSLRVGIGRRASSARS